jgi:hypothetical protein
MINLKIMNKENKIAILAVDNGGGLRIGNSVVTNVGIGNSIVFALDVYPCVSRYNLRQITNEEFKNLDWTTENIATAYLWLSKYVETFKYRIGYKINETSNENVSQYVDAPIDKRIGSGIAYDNIINKGNYIQLLGMAVPGLILSNIQKNEYIYWWYEYVIDGKVYRFELYS